VSELRAPFPWHGGKSRVADVAWRALGADCVNYIEPFFGSGAMLLGRPGGPGKIETVNDLDGGIVNFYRAIQSAPDEVAIWCDWPVSELDLHARHAWLVGRIDAMADELRADPHYFDAKAAGWWVWGICQWIGTGWCDVSRLERNAGARPHVSGDSAGMGVLKQQLPEVAIPARARTTGKGVLSEQLPHKRPSAPGDNPGRGVQKLSLQLPALRVDSGASGNGISASGKIPLLSTNGTGGSKGVLAEGLPQKVPMLALNGTGAAESGRGALSSSASESYGLPAIGNDRGINGVAAPPCQAWFRALQERLRRVRIICGDWTRVLGNSVLGKGKNVGGRRPCAVFLDPPYEVSMRAKRIYGHDSEGLSAKVREWALEHGNDPDLRIALCGYDGEHELPGWTVHAWKGARGYAREDNENRNLERIWFSPHCLGLAQQGSLFSEASHG
jgi:hypothetical protein